MVALLGRATGAPKALAKSHSNRGRVPLRVFAIAGGTALPLSLAARAFRPPPSDAVRTLVHNAIARARLTRAEQESAAKDV